MMRLTGRGFLLFTFISLFQIATVFGQEQVVDAGNSSVASDPLQVTANGVDFTTLTLTVHDDDDEPITGLVESDFSFNNTGDAVAANFTETATDGVYTVEFTSQTVETIAIQVDALEVDIGTTDEISFVEQVVDAGESSVVADPTEALADGASSSAITVTARDSDGEPIEDAVVSLDQGDGNSEIDPASATTDISGEAEFTVTNTTAESVTYTATADQEPIEQTATVDFTPVAPVAEEADQITSTEFVANWGEVSGATDYLLDVSTQPDFEGGMILTEVSTGGVTSHTVSELEPETEYHYRVRAEAPTGISNNSNVIAVTTLAEIFPAFASAEVTSDEPARLRVSFDSDVQAGGEAGFTLDAGDLDITGFVGVEDGDTVVLTLNREVNSSDDLSGSLSYDSAQGNVESTEDGSDAQSFTDEDVANNVEGFIVADPGDQTAGEEFNLNISDAQDASGQALEGEVNVTVTSNLDEEVQNEPRNFTEGSATVPVTLTTANTHELTVNVEGLSDDVTKNVIVNPGEIDAELSSVEATSPHVADGEDSSMISISVVDGHENPIANLEANDFDLDVGENAEVSDFTEVGNGDYTFGLTNTEVGEVTIQVTVDGTILVDNPIVEFVAGSAEVLAVTPLEHQVIAGNRVSFELERFDENDNPVSDGVLTIDLSSASATGEFFAQSEEGEAVTQIAIEVGQSSVTVWYTDADASVATPYELTFNGGEGELTQTAQITDVVPANAVAISELTADDNVITADGTTTVRATVVDGSGNPVEGVEVSFSSDEPDRATVDPTAITDETGQAEATISGSDSDLGEVVITGSISDEDEIVDQSDEQTVTIQVTDQVAITTTELPEWTVDQPGYDATLEAEGGTGPYSWSVTGGDLPGGLSLEAGTGEISGTPTASGTFNFTVQVEDDNGFTDTRELEIIIHPLPSITTTELPDGQAGDSYDVTIARDGGTAPFSWEVTEGELPDGLALDEESGQISGTPTLANLFEFTVELTDAAGASDSQELSIEVSPGDPATVLAETLQGTATADGESELEYLVTVEDALENPVPGVEVHATHNGEDITFTGGGDEQTTDLNGQATFTATSTSAQSVEFTFTEQENNNSATAVGNFSAGDPDHVTLAGPESVTAGQTSEEFILTVRDSEGNPAAVSEATSFALETNQEDGTAVFSTGSPVQVEAGQSEVTFRYENTLVGGGTHLISATRESGDELPGGDSASHELVVEPASADRLAFDQQPATTTAGETISPAVTVRIEDEFGNLVDDATDAVSMEIGTNPVGGELSGTLSVAAVDGIASFEDLSIDSAGEGYTLAATAEDLASAESDPFTIEPGDAAALFIAQQPEGGPSGEELETQPVIEIRDGQGNLVSDDNSTQVSVAINTAESGAGGTLGGSTTITAENGVVTFTNLTFSGLVEEEYVLRFTASGLVSIDSEPVTVTHGEASQLVLSGETGELVSGDTRELTVAIRDAQGNLVNTGPQSELEVSFNQTGGDGSVSGLGEVSAIEGMASLEVTGDEAGEVRIRAFTDAPEITSNTLTFDVNPGQADAVAVLTQPQQTVAGQTVEGPPAARVTDDSGNPVGGVAVAVSEEGGASFAAGTLQIDTGADGVATFDDLVINQANTYRLVFDASGVSDNAVSGEFDVIAANAVQIAQLTSDDDVITTDGATTVQASVVDEFDNPVEGVTVSFASDNENLASVDAESTTDGGGQASAEVTAAGEESGDVIITASIDSADENVDQSDDQTISILVTDELTITTTTLPDWTANQPDYAVQLLASGGVDPLVWSLAGDSGQLPDGLTLEEDGLLQGTPAETGTFAIIVVVEDDVGATNTRELSFTIHPQPEIITEVLPDGVAGDPYEEVIAFEGGTAPFSWEITEGVLPDGLELDEESGQISGTPTLADLFEFTVELTDAAGASDSQELSIEVSPGDPATVLAETLQGTATADGENELEYLVTVEDALENPVPGIEVHATHDGEDITFTGEGAVQTTDLNGQATFTATSTSAQSVEFTFTEQLFDNAATADGAFSAGDADRLAIAPDQHEVTAGERVSFDITRFDANENEVTQGGLTVGLSTASAAGAFFAGGEGGDSIDQIDIEDGQSSVTVWYSDTDASVATPYELTFDGGDGELTQTAQITAVIPADPASLALSADPTDPVAGQVTTLTALVTDEFDNPVPGAEADFSIEDGNGSFVGAFTGVTTDDDGLAVADYITHTTVETADLRAELSGDATIGDQVSVTSVPGDPDRVAISEITTPQTAGQAFEVTFTVQDANENTVTGFEGTLGLEVEFGGISPATVSFNAADEGERAESMTLDQSGAGQVITAEWDNDETVSGESNEFDVSAGNATQIAQLTTADDVITTDGATTVQAFVADGNGNPVAGVTVRFASDNENLATVEAESTTDSGGQASAEVTAAGEESGDVIITASIDSADENVDQSDEQSVSILVTDELTITTTSLPDWTANQPDYEVQFQASGGVDPLVWSLAGDSGLLPDGLTLEEDGLLQGTPAETGTFTITVEVADDADASDIRELSFTIHPQPEIITEVLPDGVAGEPYEEAISIEGGTAPFSWEITEGVLPDGLELDEESGQISGIPTAVDEFTFTVHMSDAAGASDEQPLSITIVTGPPAVVEVETLEGTTPADGSGELSYLVTVEDGFENPVSGVEVVATHDGEDITFTGDGDTQTTGEDGQVTFTATSTTAQQVTFTFTEQENDNSAEADGTFGDGSGFVVADPGNRTTGEPFHLLISDARGIDGSLLDGQIHVTVTSSLEDEAVHDDPAGFTEGEASVTVILSQAGSHMLTVDVDGVSENQTIDVTAEDPPEIPPAPENLVIESIDTGIRLTWDDPENGVDIREYTVYRGPSPRDLSPVVVILDGTRVYEQAISSTRFFAVTLRNQEGTQSGFSNKVSFMITTKEITEEWMMISNTSEDVQSPDSPVQLFSFNGGYSLEEEISGLNGYWINSRSGTELDIEGPGLGSGTLDLNSGWNLIGSLSDTLAVSSIDDPDGILSGAPVWRYDPSESGYVETDLLEPGQGHWIHASEAGSVELEIERSGQPEAGSMQLASQERGDIDSGDRGDRDGSQPEPQRMHEAGLERIVFKSGDAEQPFLISQATLSGEDQLRHLLPPKAPDPVLDVRTIHNYRVSDRHSAELSLTSRRYPVQVSMDQGGEAGRAYRLVLRDGNDETQMFLSADNPVSIDKEYDSIHLVRADGDERPMAFDLSQNYPNPFNPATSIRYVVPVASEVSLVVYNTLGQRVQTLVNEAHQPGQYTVEFNAGHLASGVYFVRMTAGSFVNAKKMTLIK